MPILFKTRDNSAPRLSDGGRGRRHRNRRRGSVRRSRGEIRKRPISENDDNRGHATSRCDNDRWTRLKRGAILSTRKPGLPMGSQAEDARPCRQIKRQYVARGEGGRERRIALELHADPPRASVHRSRERWWAKVVIANERITRALTSESSSARDPTDVTNPSRKSRSQIIRGLALARTDTRFAESEAATPISYYVGISVCTSRRPFPSLLARLNDRYSVRDDRICVILSSPPPETRVVASFAYAYRRFDIRSPENVASVPKNIRESVSNQPSLFAARSCLQLRSRRFVETRVRTYYVTERRETEQSDRADSSNGPD